MNKSRMLYLFIMCLLVVFAVDIALADNTDPFASATPPELNTGGLIIQTVTKTAEKQIQELSPIGTFYLTAYCSCPKCCGKYAANRPIDENGNQIVYTATGAIATDGRTIAVDPSVIKLGTEVVIDGHKYVAEDTGVSGNVIDIYFDNHSDAQNFGTQKAEVFIEIN